jgi:hypothetical protein
VDALGRDDIARSRATPPEVKLAQALAMMEAGFRLQRSKIAREHPGASGEEVEERFRAWLRRDE